MSVKVNCTQGCRVLVGTGNGKSHATPIHHWPSDKSHSCLPLIFTTASHGFVPASDAVTPNDRASICPKTEISTGDYIGKRPYLLTVILILNLLFGHHFARFVYSIYLPVQIHSLSIYHCWTILFNIRENNLHIILELGKKNLIKIDDFATKGFKYNLLGSCGMIFLSLFVY